MLLVLLAYVVLAIVSGDSVAAHVPPTAVEATDSESGNAIGDLIQRRPRIVGAAVLGLAALLAPMLMPRQKTLANKRKQDAKWR